MSTSLVPDKVRMRIGNDNEIAVRLYDKKAAAFLDNTATVTATLYDHLGAQIAQAPLNFVTGSVTGDFIGTMFLALMVLKGTGYVLLIEGTQGAATYREPKTCEVTD